MSCHNHTCSYIQTDRLWGSKCMYLHIILFPIFRRFSYGIFINSFLNRNIQSKSTDAAPKVAWIRTTGALQNASRQTDLWRCQPSFFFKIYGFFDDWPFFWENCWQSKVPWVMSLTWTFFIFFLQVQALFSTKVRHKSSTFQLLQDIVGKASSTFGRWLQPADALQTWWFSSKKSYWLQVRLLFAPRHFAKPKFVLLYQSCGVPCFPFQLEDSFPNPPISARHVYADPAAVIFQVRQLRKFFPNSPIHVMSCLPWQVSMVGATNKLFETSKMNHPQLAQLLPTVCVVL